MSALLDFLTENPIDNVTEKVTVSQRLKAYPFTIRAMTSPEFSDYQKAATSFGRHKKVDFNTAKFSELVVLNHTVEPNFRNAESIKKAGCLTPEQFLYKSLLAGEISELSQHISELSGFDNDMEDLVEEVKNS